MPHIHTNPGQHDLTTTAYIVRIDSGRPRALVHMHRRLNRLLPIGGHVELNETPWQAITHELEEESGYRLEQLKILQPASRIKALTKVVQHPYPLSLNTHDIPGKHFHTDIQYGFITESEPAMAIEDGESTDLRWLTLEEMYKLPDDMIFENTKEVYKFLVEEALQSWKLVDTKHYLLEYPHEYLEEAF